jgi:hypothetical protein
MALTTPIVENVNSFDATLPTELKFKVLGATDQIVKNEIKIINNTTSEVVYNHTEYTLLYEQEVPANTLANGVYYSVQFRVYNANDEHSNWSLLEDFYCYTTPTVSLNLIDGQVVNSSNVQVTLTYNQAQNELFDCGYLYLYDEEDNLLEKSRALTNQSTTLPLTVSTTFEGLVNTKTYKVKGEASTVNGTTVYTPVVSFHIHYINPIIKSELYLKNLCEEGCVDISSELKVVMGRYSLEDEDPVYINNEAVDLLSSPCAFGNQFSKYVTFDSGYSVPNTFLIRAWFKVGDVGYPIMTVKSRDNEDGFTVWYKQDDVKSFIQIESRNGAILVSDNLPKTNGGNNYYFMWLSHNNGTWNLRVSCLNTVQQIFNWNDDNNNVLYFTTVDLKYDDESYIINKPQNKYKPYKGMIDNIVIGNAIFYGLTVSNNPNIEYTSVQPASSTIDVIINCLFEGNLDGGNLASGGLSQIISMKLKRKLPNDYRWATIYEKNIQTFDDLNIHFKDYCVPSGIEQEYALVAVLNGNVESDYFTNTIVPTQNGIVIAGTDRAYKISNGVVYSSITQNRQLNALLPIGRTYPVIVQNSKIKYKTGTLQGMILGYTFDEERQIIVNDVVAQTEEIIDFLCDGKAKVITDWNGNVWLVRITDNPVVSPKDTTGATNTISFSWTEQGKYNVESDLIENNLIVKE